MKEEIQEMINLIKSDRYDREETHADYDSLLEQFILNLTIPEVYDESLLPLMKELIALKKDFWYA